MTMRIAVCAVLTCATVLTLVPAGAQEGGTERFRGTASHAGAGPGGQTRFELEISRWTTSEETTVLRDALATNGRTALADALNDQEEVGWIRFPEFRTQFPTTALFYSREIAQDGKRIIELATARPIGLFELMRGPDTADYNVAMIRIELDENGRGEGLLAVAVMVRYDEQHHRITAESFGQSPVRLRNVRGRD